MPEKDIFDVWRVEMGLYFAVYIALIVFSVGYYYLSPNITITVSNSYKRSLDDLTYKMVLVVLMFMVMLRYGQGQDYFNYKYLFNLGKLAPTELLWREINAVFVAKGWSYELLLGVIAIINTLLLNRFIEKYCKGTRCLCILLLYHTFYLTYMFSALRQGLVMCIFLGIMIPLYEKKKYVWYALLVIVCALIHLSSLFFILLFISNRIQRKNQVRLLEQLTMISILVGFGMHISGIYSVVSSLMPALISSHVSGSGIGYFAVIRRIALLLVMIRMIRVKEMSDFENKLYYYYLMGNIVYFLLMGNALLTGRLFELFGEGIEVMFIANYFCEKQYSKMNMRKVAIFSFLIIYCSIMFFKNIDGSITLGNYRTDVNCLNYPYISILNKEELTYYRDVTGIRTYNPLLE